MFKALLSKCMFGTDNVKFVLLACVVSHMLLTANVAGKMVIACVHCIAVRNLTMNFVLFFL